MIQQHFLQQQRLNYNHDRLLERYYRLLTPKIAQFRSFGTSALPGRKYDQYLNMRDGKHHRKNSLIVQSRAGIGSSSETYRLMGEGASEILPRNVSSVMQHTRQQPVPLVHAEKFEPVQVYEHPVFGPTPAYLRPVYSERPRIEEIRDNNSDKDESEEDAEVRSHTSGDTLKTNRKEETKTTPTIVKNDDEDGQEDSDKAPRGYISYKKWKAKYENLIPVNPLLFNIYTKRPNGSINSYGQSLYASPPRHRQLSHDDDFFTPTSSEIESISSEIPHDTSLSSHRKYYRLQPQLIPKSITPRPLEPIHTEGENDSSDDESSPPDSPVPYLSRNKQNPFPSTPLSTNIPSTSIIPSSVSTTMPASTLNTPTVNTTGMPQQPFVSTNTSNIPPAPSMPPSSVAINTSNIPPAPPMPPSLATTSSTVPYETRSSIAITSPPIAPPMPTFLTTSTSTAPYQAPSNVSVPPPSAPSLIGSTTKAVTFAGLSSVPATNNDDISSSSDSDDDEKQKRRRRKKRQAAGGDIDSSSSDD